MKKILLFIISMTSFLMVGDVFAASNPYPHYETSVFGGKIVNCTWYAWQAAKDRMGVELPLWYYAQTWYSKASKAGYAVGKEPRVNSLMVWDYGEGFGGHISYVTKVEGDVITYDEGGSPMTESGINTDSLRMSDMQSFLVGFIYLDVPRVTTTKKVTTKATTKKPTTTTTTTTSTITTTTESTTTIKTTESTTTRKTENNISNKKVEKTNNSKIIYIIIGIVSVCLLLSLLIFIKRK